MMKIGLVGDTHIPGTASELPPELLKGLRGVDLILHTGDICELGALGALEEIAPVRAVWGNMDPPPVRKALPETIEVEVEGFRIGLTHGTGAPLGIVKRVMEQLKGFDCIVFGHTHSPLNETRGDVLVVNPGTPTDHRFASVNTYGILTVDEGLSASIIELARP